MLNDPRLANAIAFANGFCPDPGIQFDWVYDLAKGRYDCLAGIFKTFNDKAGAVVSSLGGGTGIFTLGSLAAIAADKVNTWVVLSAMPSVILATLALCFAVRVRMSKTITYPSPDQAVQYVRDLLKDGNPKAAFIGSWHFAAEQLRIVTDAKSRDLNRSYAFFAAAVGFILLPLTVGIVVRSIA